MTRFSAILIMSLISCLLCLCGCRSNGMWGAPVAGPDATLKYPVVVLEKETETIAVRDTPEKLTSTSAIDPLNGFYPKAQIVDAEGALYRIVRVRPAEKVPKWPLDYGGTKYRVEMRLKSEGKVTLDEAKGMLRQIVQNPKSFWSESHDGNGPALKKIQNAPTFAQLIEACRAL